jgi:hypothetical protein
VLAGNPGGSEAKNAGVFPGLSLGSLGISLMDMEYMIWYKI